MAWKKASLAKRSWGSTAALSLHPQRQPPFGRFKTNFLISAADKLKRLLISRNPDKDFLIPSLFGPGHLPTIRVQIGAPPPYDPLREFSDNDSAVETSRPGLVNEQTSIGIQEIQQGQPKLL